MNAGEPLIDWVGRSILVLGTAAVITAFIFGTGVLAGSVALGVALAWGNLWMLRALGRRLVAKAGQGKALGLLFFKFLLLIGLIFAITRWLPLDVMGLLGGFSTGVVSIVGGTWLGPPSDAVAVSSAAPTPGTARGSQGTPVASHEPPSGEAG